MTFCLSFCAHTRGQQGITFAIPFRTIIQIGDLARSRDLQRAVPIRNAGVLYILSGKAFAIRILLMFLRIDVGASAVEAVFLGGLKLIVSKSEVPAAESPRGGGSRNIGGKPVVALLRGASHVFWLI